jgi:fructose-1,6-bisphosphatase I
MVYTAGHGVHEFTYDRESGQFLQPKGEKPMRISSNNGVYSVNDGNWGKWTDQDRQHIIEMRQQGMGARYSGAMVADLHGILVSGGCLFTPQMNIKQAKLDFHMKRTNMVVATGGKAINGEVRYS